MRPPTGDIDQPDDGRVLALEVKVGSSVNDGDVVRLKWLQRMLR
jgi:hypothetical protein